MTQPNFVPNQITAPQWAGDYFDRESLLPGGAKADPTQFPATDAVTATSPAGAALGATAIPVSALTNPIPSGTLLYFGAGVYARLTALAALGATSLAVEALPVAVPAGASATYLGLGKKTVRSGTYVGRTYAERDAGTGFGPAASTDDERFLVAFEVPDLARNNDIDLYRHNKIVRENFLPDYTAISANSALLAKLRADYTCTKGAA
jgi:hypothetical protein